MIVLVLDLVRVVGWGEGWGGQFLSLVYKYMHGLILIFD